LSEIHCLIICAIQLLIPNKRRDFKTKRAVT